MYFYIAFQSILGRSLKLHEPLKPIWCHNQLVQWIHNLCKDLMSSRLEVYMYASSSFQYLVFRLKTDFLIVPILFRYEFESEINM